MLVSPSRRNEDFAQVSLGDDAYGRWMVMEGRRKVPPRPLPKVQAKSSGFLRSNNLFAILEEKDIMDEAVKKGVISSSVLGGKEVGLMDVVCPVIMGDRETRLAEVRPIEEEMDEDELVDEEIIIDREPGREESLESGGEEVALGDSRKYGVEQERIAVGDQAVVVQEEGSSGGLVVMLAEQETCPLDTVLRSSAEQETCPLDTALMEGDGGLSEGREKSKGKLAAEKSNMLKPRVQGKARGRGRRRSTDAKEDIGEFKDKVAGVS